MKYEIEPNYNQTVDELAIEVTLNCIRRSGDLKILSLARYHKQVAPSWALDLGSLDKVIPLAGFTKEWKRQAPFRQTISPSTFFSTNLIESGYELVSGHDNGMLLTLQGYRMDFVTGTSEYSAASQKNNLDSKWYGDFMPVRILEAYFTTSMFTPIGFKVPWTLMHCYNAMSGKPGVV
jgi:hypothetical protein